MCAECNRPLAQRLWRLVPCRTVVAPARFEANQIILLIVAGSAATKAKARVSPIRALTRGLLEKEAHVGLISTMLTTRDQSAPSEKGCTFDYDRLVSKAEFETMKKPEFRSRSASRGRKGGKGKGKCNGKRDKPTLRPLRCCRSFLE